MDPERWKQVDRPAAVRAGAPARRARRVSAAGVRGRRGAGAGSPLAADARTEQAGSSWRVRRWKLPRGRSLDSESTRRRADLLIGQTISHYRIVEKLGGGGMGVVYKAEDTRLQRSVALKFLSDEFARDPEALNRFRREARAASALNHPNICTIHDIGEQDGRAFIVMEYLEGATLKERIAGGALWRWKRCWRSASRSPMRWMPPTPQASSTATSSRPTFSSPQRDHAKILDFGLAQSRRAGRRPRSLVTRAGHRAGTRRLHVAGAGAREAVDARADLFSFGLVLYEMATGTRPRGRGRG